MTFVTRNCLSPSSKGLHNCWLPWLWINTRFINLKKYEQDEIILKNSVVIRSHNNVDSLSSRSRATDSNDIVSTIQEQCNNYVDMPYLVRYWVCLLKSILYWLESTGFLIFKSSAVTEPFWLKIGPSLIAWDLVKHWVPVTSHSYIEYVIRTSCKSKDMKSRTAVSPMATWRRLSINIRWKLVGKWDCYRNRTTALNLKTDRRRETEAKIPIVLPVCLFIYSSHLRK